jgi:hypothetical protein
VHDAGVVHDDVESPERLLGAVVDPLTGVRCRHVEHHSLDTSAGVFTDLLCHRVQFGTVEVGDQDVGAAAGQGQRVGGAHPAGRPGDECDPAREADIRQCAHETVSAMCGSVM